MLTRKHFNALAIEVGDMADFLTPEQLEQVTERISNFCATQNPGFDRDRFEYAVRERAEEVT